MTLTPVRLFYFIRYSKRLLKRVLRRFVKMKVLGVEFAPLNVPWKRRLETAAALVWISIPVIMPLWFWFGYIYVLLFTRFYYVPLFYIIYYYLDCDTPQVGGRIFEPVRNWTIWKHLNDYFPLTVVKTCDIPTDRNYLFCFYPHGVLSANALVHFTTNGSDFHKLYPGFVTYFATLDVHFRTPFLRELVIALGIVSSSQRSLLNLLDSEKKGTAVALIVGGAQEALYAKPGSTRIVLKKRKGFIKVALRSGASIVPVYGFGENDLYEQVPNPPGSFLLKLQEYTKKKTGLAPVIPIGRGLFQYSFGIIPRRHPIHTVFGEPIHLPREEEPTDDSIEKYHKLFTEKLIELFEEHKHKYIENASDAHLIME